MSTVEDVTGGRKVGAVKRLSRTERRVVRTKTAIEEAFVALVLQRGYERVKVEEIVAEADVAKATFYAHYPNKEALLSVVFSRLVEELGQRVMYREGPWFEVRRGAVEAAYEHAAEMRDLYKVCLSDTRARSAYMATLTRYAEQNFADRLAALGRRPQVPVVVMARAFAGSHVAILESWLAGDIEGSPQDIAAMELDLAIAGTAWGHNVSLAELGYTTDPAPPPADPQAGPSTQ